MPAQPVTAVETFSNPAPEHDYTIRMTIPEFTCLCPMTGQPDFETLELEYVPDRLCVELKSLKLYIWSFRDRGACHKRDHRAARSSTRAALHAPERPLQRARRHLHQRGG